MKNPMIIGALAAVAAFAFFAMQKRESDELEYINYEDLPRKRGAVGFGKLGIAGPGE